MEGGREARPGSDGGLNQQSGLNCTGHAPSRRGPGYRRIYGETTKHALEASVLTSALSMVEWDREVIAVRSGLGEKSGLESAPMRVRRRVILPIPTPCTARGRACHLRVRRLTTGTREPSTGRPRRRWASCGDRS
jgi:hypothetical protein